ncbi:MAG: UbiH/UbiF/VisC/COQ6 family ubiquinone biosynthesis hydroxylase [Alphaproteobacteria bacterium]
MIDADVLADVLIIGGGMVGLTLATALGAEGLDVTVLDRDDPRGVLDAAFDGRVSAIALGSRRVLETLDLWRVLAPEAEAIRDIRVSDGASPLVLDFDHSAVGDEPMGHIVENRALRRALLQRVTPMANVQLLAPVKVVSLAFGVGKVEVALDDGRKPKARLLVAADGRNSWTRHDQGIATTEWSYPQAAIVCTVVHSRPHRGLAHERFLPPGPFAILPMTDDSSKQGQVRHRSSIVWTEHAERVPELLALDDVGFNQELARRFGGELGDVAVLGGRWSYPLSLMLAERYVGDRLALVGDAGHAIHPIAGQGLNMGLRDVAACAEVVVEAWRLGLDIGHGVVLERYQEWRRFDNVTLAAVTDGLNRLFSNDVAPVRMARRVGLAAINRIAPAKRLFMHHAMGVVGDLPRLVRGEPL